MQIKRVFREIHLWLSVPFGLIITAICFSGAMLVFEKEITEMLRHDLYYVKEVKAEPLPMQELMEAVEETLPDSVSISSVTVSPDKERTWQVALSKPRRASVYVDPYTGEVTGKNERLPFFDVMFHLHRWLMGSSGNDGFSLGKFLTGVSTLVLVLILLTGLLMWLTNRNKPLTRSLTICVTKGWRRFWHDLHVAGGIYATIFLLAIALTGLTWSFSWYRTGFYALFGVESNEGGNAHSNRGGNAQEGNGRNGHGRNGLEGNGHHRDGRRHGEGFHGSSGEGFHGSFGEGHGGGWHRSPYRHWQSVLEELASRNPGYQAITLSKESAKVVPAGRNSMRATDNYEYDRRSGEITSCTPYAEQDRSGKVRSAVYTVHTGSWGGMLTRIINFIVSLLGATLPLTGYYLWIKRLCNKHKSTK